jgi:hypothetical protein
MSKIIGEAVGPAGQKEPFLTEALRNALKKAPPPPPGTDFQTFELLSVELMQGGFVGTTTTRVTLVLKDPQEGQSM